MPWTASLFLNRKKQRLIILSHSQTAPGCATLPYHPTQMSPAEAQEPLSILWLLWAPLDACAQSFSGFLNSPEDGETGMDIPASLGCGDAVDLPQQNCIFWFVPSSSPHHSQNLIPFLAPY